VALLALAVGIVPLAGCANQQNTPAAPASGAAPPPADATAVQQDYVQVVEHVQPSVVQITTDRGLGSGIVFDNTGSANTSPASLVGAYPPDDIALIHLNSPPPSLRPAQFGNSSAVRVGEIVLAMGNPLGLTGSVTNGIVSATGRTVTEPPGGGSPGATLPDAIQTSAAINPGNSGGALVNLSGQVIGMPTLAALDPELGESAAPGIGFAISSNRVQDIAGQMIANNGSVTNTHRADLGVRVMTVTGSGSQPAGAGIASVVAGGPAAMAGLTTGGIITAINGTPVRSASELVAALANLNPGTKATVTVTDTNGQSHPVTVTLGQLPAS
jgi:S1-C subfamily serine protease